MHTAIGGCPPCSLWNYSFASLDLQTHSEVSRWWWKNTEKEEKLVQTPRKDYNQIVIKCFQICGWNFPHTFVEQRFIHGQKTQCASREQYARKWKAANLHGASTSCRGYADSSTDIIVFDLPAPKVCGVCHYHTHFVVEKTDIMMSNQIARYGVMLIFDPQS